MDTISAGLVIVGIVNGIRLLQEKNVWGFIFFVTALAAGIILGILHLFGLTIEVGLLTGIGSSGLYRVGQVIGGK